MAPRKSSATEQQKAAAEGGQIERDVPARYEPEAMYDVQLTRSIEVGGRKLRAAHSHRLRGDHCAANADNIWRATKAPEE